MPALWDTSIGFLLVRFSDAKSCFCVIAGIDFSTYFSFRCGKYLLHRVSDIDLSALFISRCQIVPFHAFLDIDFVTCFIFRCQAYFVMYFLASASLLNTITDAALY